MNVRRLDRRLPKLSVLRVDKKSEGFCVYRLHRLHEAKNFLNVFFNLNSRKAPRAVIKNLLDKNPWSGGRLLKEFHYTYRRELLKLLRPLNAQKHWLDLGAGDGLMQLGLMARTDMPDLPRMTAISYRLSRRVPKKLGNRYRMISGRLFESIPAREIGKADLITDHVGVLSHTPTLTQTFRKYLNLLEPGGRILVSGPFSKTLILRRDGSLVSWDVWLRSIRGLRCTTKASSIIISKSKNQINIPNLRLVGARHDFYLYRYFEEAPGEG